MGIMRDNRRDRIVVAARDLLNQNNGRRALTIGRVAAAARVSRATVYRYFRDRPTLLRATSTSGGPAPDSAEPRVRILEAALELFGERGIHAATLGEIASRAGLSLSGLHWHYRNKDELVADLAQYIPLLPTIAAEVAEAGAEAADLELQLTRIADVILDLLERRRGLFRFILFEAEVYPDVARLALTHGVGRGLPLLVQLFEQHACSGSLRPGSAQARAQAFMGMFAALALLRPAFASLLAPDDRETAREYVEIMLRGVLAGPERD
jgi:AcrR family transcriptional regulator